MQALKKFIHGVLFGITILGLYLFIRILTDVKLASDEIFTLGGIINLLGTTGFLYVIAMRSG